MVTEFGILVVLPGMETVKGEAGAVKSVSTLLASIAHLNEAFVGLKTCITTVVDVEFEKATEGLAAHVPLYLHQKSLAPTLVLLMAASAFHVCPPVTEIFMVAVVFLT